jgi:hypothetical protein
LLVIFEFVENKQNEFRRFWAQATSNKKTFPIKIRTAVGGN